MTIDQLPFPEQAFHPVSHQSHCSLLDFFPGLLLSEAHVLQGYVTSVITQDSI